ncbi:hypothetical protein C4K68_23640 [Pokkaliibacter plantistimulans]|uniref:O-antigen ligase-related domain-containing protein n=1 Tax=Proteobacteria bacterium 228 TaxID=2083153 RepID=A0A2S5KJL0_9PROT|nr:O-antigen ligase family protein [Pokkaliibacter plantistimulans]PPC74968.1 hypothetical protein C4K68_23640 [Pokkaliibacter plantistimulans]
MVHQGSSLIGRFLFCSYLVVLAAMPLPFGLNRSWAVNIFAAVVFVLMAVWLFTFSVNKTTLPSVVHKAKIALLSLISVQIWLIVQMFYPLSADPVAHFPHLLTISQDIPATAQSLVLGLAYTCWFVLTLIVVNSTKRLRLLLYVLVGSGVFQAFYGSMMVMTGLEMSFLVPKTTYLGNATGTFINRNHLAGYLVLCLAAGIALMIASLHQDRAVTWREWSRRILKTLLGGKFRLRLCLVVMVIALVMTHSRMGNTAFFSSMLISGLMMLLVVRKPSRSLVVLVTSLIAVDILLVGTFFGFERVVDRIQATTIETETRVEVNEYAYQMFLDHPWAGIGAGGFYSSFPAYRQFDVGPAFFDHAHNDYLEFLIERGVIGTAPLLLFVVLSFYTAIRAMRQRNTPLLRDISFAPIMAIIALGIHSTVDFNLQIPANAATFLTILALSWVALYTRAGDSRLATRTAEEQPR